MSKERGEKMARYDLSPTIYGLSNRSKSTELRFITDIAGRAAETSPGRWKIANRTLSISVV